MSDPVTLSPVKRALAAIQSLQAELAAAKERRDEPIAIIGMSCRYPGADNLEAFWKLLCNGEDAITEVPRDRWNAEAFYDPDSSRPGTIVSRKGGFLKNLDRFDAAFFGISPREAPHVDPRQRLLLEISWEALEHAGIPPDSLAGKAAGVFIASLTNDYDHLLFEDLRRADAYSGAGTANSVLANRISYFLDFRGPSLVVDTACSGSLVALHLACESLQRGEISLALTGGVNVNLMPKSNVFFSRAGALSPNGRCATFDQEADGMVRSDGAGIVVLKLLSKALADNDPVIAVIKGSAINHDGRSNGIMAPNGQAQEAVLREAYRRAGIEPKDVQYLEAHGTGTRLGDPVEVQALGSVLGNERAGGRKCVLGSVKTNIGHTEAAAGIAGVIKTALAMQRRLLPPTLHFQNANPLIGLDQFPFEVRTELSAWPAESQPLTAGVSAFGFGGTNAHVVLQQAPVRQQQPEQRTSLGSYVLTISARTRESLRDLASSYLSCLATTKLDFGDFCYTAAAGRSHHGHRVALSAASSAELKKQLEEWLSRPREDSEPEKPRVAFVFSGQGSHWPGMGRRFYTQEPVFRAALDQCSQIFSKLVSWSLIEEIFREGSASRLDETGIAQPAIFSIEVALAALWKAWGVRPDVVVGHSLGETAAAYVGGAISLEEAALVVFERSRLMQRVAGHGKTAVVGLAFEEAKNAIRDREAHLAVAGSNSPSTSVLSGDPESLAALSKRLDEKGVFCKLLRGVEIAFHSPQMDALLPELTAALSSLKPRTAPIPIISTVTGSFIDGRNLDSGYWGRNLRDPFLFTSATEQLLESGYNTILEISPHPVLGSAILQTVQRSQKSVAVLGSLRRNENSRENMLDSLARLYTSGQNIAWSQVYDRSHNRVALPHYPWRRQRYWFDQLGTGSQELSKADDGKAHPLLGERVDAAGEEGLSIWQTEIDATNPPYLADHRVRGEVLFPGAASAEMLLEAAAQLFPGCKPSITGITFERPLRLETGKPRQVQLLVSAREGEANASLYSRPRGGNGPWTRHVTGKLQSAALLPLAPKVSIVRIKARCSRAMVPEEHYQMMEAHGLEYGPSFRSIRRLWCGDGEALAEIGPSSASQDTRYQLHPTLLDSCLQTVAAAIRERANSANNSYLPFGFKSWQMAQPAGDHFWCHARLVTEPGSDTLEANLDLIAEDGRLIAKLEGLSLRRLPTQTQTLKDHLLELRWDAKPLDPQVRRNLSGKWLIFGGSGALADDLQSQMTQRGCQTILARRGDTYRAIDGTHFVIRPDNREDTNRLLDRVGALDGILHLWSLDAHSVEDIDSLVYGSSLHLIQSAAKLQSLQRLIFVTSQAQPVSSGPLEIAQSPLWGLTLVANQERPELNCACIDLDAANARENAAILLQEMEADDSEKRTGWRKGVRYAVRLVKTTLADRLAQKITSAANGTFLITGGLGALGLLTAEALVSRGVRHLALVSRRAEDHPSLEQLRRLGAQVNVLQADVAQLDQAEKVFAKISADMPPLKGVIHAAGVLEDGVLDNQSLASFQCVCAPKIKGAWNLHLCSKNHPVEVFVCFSSAASLVGSSGQANYAAANAFLDAFAHHRRSLGLPACSINWSIWNEAGMGQKDTLRRMSARGIMPIEPSAGLNLFCDLVENDPAPPQIGVFPVEWPKFLAQYSGPAPKLFEYFLKSPIQRENFHSQFSSIRLEDRALTLTGRVQQLLAMTLAIDPSTHISSRERFFELGMDSLTAMEFRNRLQGDLGVTLPSTLAFDYPTLDALTSYLKTLVPVNTEKPAERNESADSELDALSHDELVRLLALELGEIRVNAH